MNMSHLFMATHMMYERMAPEAPIRDPTTVIRLLFNMKPSAHNAQPEYEFNTVITTIRTHVSQDLRGREVS